LSNIAISAEVPIMPKSSTDNLLQYTVAYLRGWRVRTPFREIL